MHLDAPRVVIDPGYVGKLVQVKVGLEFAIDSGKQVQVESSRHPEFVIVGLEQLGAGLLQVGSEKKRIAGLENSPHFGQELHTRTTIKVSNCAPEEQHEQALAFLAIRRHVQQAIEIFALKTENADGIDVAQFPFAHSQC